MTLNKINEKQFFLVTTMKTKFNKDSIKCNPFFAELVPSFITLITIGRFQMIIYLELHDWKKNIN